ncbi:MAG: sialate O-acetylesterase, partial [Armatimonadetes bacterium]|nr:sialate O-acetylesterase [Armatimonadota bacterium]
MKVRSIAGIAVAGAALLLGSPARAAETHPLFSDGAVLQQGMPVPVWGTGQDGESVTVEIQGQRASTTVHNGKWVVRLKKLKPGGPFTMTIGSAGQPRITGNVGVGGGVAIQVVRNVLVGEVWICSGQSNMQWALRQTRDPEKAAAASSNSQIRLLTIPRVAKDQPQSTVEVNWRECGPSTTPDFSAVAYYFGRDLQKELGVPIGLISTNYGGTPAEAWTRREVLEGNPVLQGILTNHDRARRQMPMLRLRHEMALREHQAAAEAARQAGRPVPPAPRLNDPSQSPQRPCGLYNAMIAPLIPYAIRGAIWYQGESNAGRAWEYRTLFPAMIKNWRDDWGQGDFPFLFVQLAPFMRIVQEPGESNWAELREAQLYTAQTVPNTAQAVITDAGEENDIHPKWKEPVGQRLALAARRLAYGHRIEHSGPVYAKHRVDGNR